MAMTRFLLLAAEVAMRSFVLIVGVGLVAAPVAHAQDCGPSPPFWPNPSNIDTHVFKLDNSNYTPIAPGLADAVTPSCTSADTQNGAIIKKAFALAPAGLQKDLCSLKCIVTGSSGSWGKWANPKFRGDDSAVIGVATDDLNIMLSKKLDSNLLSIHAYHTITAGDTIERSLMYTLAHEMAHIKWRRDIPKTGSSCPIDPFIAISWQGHAGTKVRRWTYFGNELGNFKSSTMIFPSQVTSDDDVRTIYNGGFATALAATNPEEDFVESYAIGAIMPPSGASATITLNLSSGNPISVDDPNFRGSTDLTKKIGSCAFSLLGRPVTNIDRGGVYPQKKGHGRKRR
jgi:hypothetical protein